MRLRGPSAWSAYGLAAGWVFWAALPFSATGAEHVSDAAVPGLRIAMSETIAGEMNANDIRAAIKSWAEAVARQTGVRIEPELCTTGQLVQKIRNHQVDAFSVNVLEFAQVAAYAARELVVEEADVVDAQEYVLLVHQSSGIRNLAELRGRSMLLYRNRAACMDRIWLDTLLASARLGTADTLLGRIESNSKLSRVVLPVFFRQTDACLVTRRGFNTMCDLNPQLSKQLQPLAVSPKLMTTFLAFHKDTLPETKQRFLAAIANLNKTVEGRQAMLLFGGTHLVPADVSLLRNGLEMLHTYDRLKGKSAAAGQ
jgi:phosphonate transport system substrate-binding protein